METMQCAGDGSKISNPPNKEATIFQLWHTYPAHGLSTSSPIYIDNYMCYREVYVILFITHWSCFEVTWGPEPHTHALHTAQLSRERTTTSASAAGLATDRHRPRTLFCVARGLISHGHTLHTHALHTRRWSCYSVPLFAACTNNIATAGLGFAVHTATHSHRNGIFYYRIQIGRPRVRLPYLNLVCCGDALSATYVCYVCCLCVCAAKPRPTVAMRGVRIGAIMKHSAYICCVYSEPALSHIVAGETVWNWISF